MKRSLQVSAPLLAAAALALTTGCRKPEMQRCVDEKNQVVPDSFCQNTQQPVHSPTGGFYYPYRYYYGGYGGYGIGTPVSGGGYVPSPGASYATSTTRGGFGSSSGSSGGGDSSSGSGS